MSQRRPSPQLHPPVRVAPASRPALRVVKARGNLQELGPLPAPTLPPRRSGIVAGGYEPEWHDAPDTGRDEEVATLRRASVPPPASSGEALIDFQSDEYLSGTSTSIWTERGSCELDSVDDIFDMDELGVLESNTARGKLPVAAERADSFEDLDLFNESDESAEEEAFWLSRSREVVAASGEVEVTRHASVQAMRKARTLGESLCAPCAPGERPSGAGTILPGALALPAPFPLIPLAERVPLSSMPPARNAGSGRKVRREATSVLVLRGLVWFVVGTTIGLLGAEYLQRAVSEPRHTTRAQTLVVPQRTAPPAAAPHAPHASAPLQTPAPQVRAETPGKALAKGEAKAAALPAVDVNRLPKANRFGKSRPASASTPAAAVVAAPGPQPLTPKPQRADTTLSGAEAIPDLDALLTQTLGRN